MENMVAPLKVDDPWKENMIKHGVIEMEREKERERARERGTELVLLYSKLQIIYGVLNFGYRSWIETWKNGIIFEKSLF